MGGLPKQRNRDIQRGLSLRERESKKLSRFRVDKCVSYALDWYHTTTKGKTMAWTFEDAREEAAYEAALEEAQEAADEYDEELAAEYESAQEYYNAREAEQAFQEERAYFHSAR